MKYIKHIILTAMAVVVMTGAWAQTSPEKQPNGSWQFTMPAANKLLEVENYESRLDSVRTTWEVYINEASTAVHPTPYSDTDTMGYVIIPAGADVKITPKPEGQAAMVSKLELIDKTAPSCRRITLDTVQHHFVAQDCDTLTGTLNANVKISIADGATVTLDGVSINANGNWTSGYYAGITCEGDATLILKDDTTNTVKGFDNYYPGIYVPENSTLTIQGETLGTGKLIASSSSDGFGAGIGGGHLIHCGSILIEGGIIETTGYNSAAGIGSGFQASCGAITITGGTVEAIGGNNAAGIGSGFSNASCNTITITGGTVEATGGEKASGIGSGFVASCGDIMITSGVTRVTATKGADATNSIGKGSSGSCGTVTIGGTQGAKTNSPYTYQPQP